MDVSDDQMQAARDGEIVDLDGGFVLMTRAELDELIAGLPEAGIYEARIAAGYRPTGQKTSEVMRQLGVA